MSSEAQREGLPGRERGAGASPTVDPTPAGLSPALERNIRALEARQRRELADGITRFVGSVTFAALHAAIFGAWIAVNAGLVPGLPRWDASFIILGTGASVEAIFLSTFVLISQNRMAAVAEKRADLNLQISLLAEHEVTRLAALTAQIAERLGIDAEADPEVREIERDVAPEAVLDRIEAKGTKADAPR